MEATALTPVSTTWTLKGPFYGDAKRTEIIGAVYERRGVRVISTCVDSDYPDGIGRGPQIHLSVSRRGHRPAESDVRLVMAAFGLADLDPEEDNHHPGVARHFWLPLDPAHRVACQCKATETTVRESDGYTWTNPTTGACRGCALELLWLRLGGGRRPCPIHRPQ